MTQFKSIPHEMITSTLAGGRIDTTYAISKGWGAVFPIWRLRARSRTALRGLTPDQLADVGISSAMACREGAKWFWQA